MYDFPASPTENQEFIPPGAGQTYIYKAPRWMVKGIPPIAGEGGGGGIDEAPVDGQQYAREDAAWSVIEPGVSDWADIENKPATFPPTVPIPWTDVSGKPATFPPTVPIPWTDVSGKPSTFPPTLPIGWSDVSGKPATFPPTLPIASSGVTGLDAAQAAQDTAIAGKAPTVHTHAQADVNNLLTDLGLKAPLASPVFTGTPTGPTPAAADSSAALATTSFVKVQGYTTSATVTSMLSTYATLFSPVFTGNPTAPTPAVADNDTSVATTAFVAAAITAALATIVSGAVIADTAPSHAPGKLWWNSANGNLYISYNDGTSTQWVQVNTVGA